MNNKDILSYFGTGYLDRVSHKRHDSEWIVSCLSEETTRFIPVRQLKNFFALGEKPVPIYLSYTEIQAFLPTPGHAILLGQKDQCMYFALDLPSERDSHGFIKEKNWGFKDLRFLSPLLHPEDCALLAYARGMVYWHQRHQYCGNCGSQTTSSEGGFVRLCVNEACKQRHFPRVDPSIIVLVTFEESCLFGRQPVWPKGFYSTIAGFVEPGERLEDAVIREVMEETGIDVENMRYFSSDPWPFPSSLMLGFTAQARNTDITINGHELEDAGWFTREDIKRQVADKRLRLPLKSSIAFRLIETWYDAGNCGKLEHVL